MQVARQQVRRQLVCRPMVLQSKDLHAQADRRACQRPDCTSS